jgi:transposase
MMRDSAARPAKLNPNLIQTNESLPSLARELFAILATEYVQLQPKTDEIETKHEAWHKGNECCRRLAQITGVGPIGATLLLMKTRSPDTFRSGRQFAAWIGPYAGAATLPGRQAPQSPGG